MLWVIVGVVVLGAVFVVGALLGSSVSRAVAGDRMRHRDLDLAPDPFGTRAARTTRPARTLFDG